jgi:hypothetical protein
MEADKKEADQVCCAGFVAVLEGLELVAVSGAALVDEALAALRLEVEVEHGLIAAAPGDVKIHLMLPLRTNFQTWGNSLSREPKVIHRANFTSEGSKSPLTNSF